MASLPQPEEGHKETMTIQLRRGWASLPESHSQEEARSGIQIQSLWHRTKLLTRSCTLPPFLYFVLFFKAIMASSYTHPSLYLALYNLAICSEYRRGSFAMKKKCKSTSFHSLLPPSTFFLTQNPYSGGKKAPATCYKSNSLPGPMGSSYLTGPGQAPGVSVTVFLVAQKTVPSCKSGPSPEDQVEVPAAAGLPMTSGQATLPWLSKQVALGTQPGEVCHSALLPPSTYS